MWHLARGSDARAENLNTTWDENLEIGSPVYIYKTLDVSK
jgi:hypothetical protein